MRCKKCNNRLAVHDLWCMHCGTQTPVIKNDLSAMASLKRSFKSVRPNISQMVPISGFSLLLGALPIAVLSWVFISFVHYDTVLSLLLNLLIRSLLFSVFATFILLPISLVVKQDGYLIKRDELKVMLKNYPRYFIFSLLNAAFYSLIYLICFGFPGFASDPILRLVWIVLANYWLAISLPALIIMERKELSPLKALHQSYRHLHDLRWNIYLLALVLGLMNFLGFALLIFPALFALPIAWFALRDYVDLLISYELLDYRI